MYSRLLLLIAEVEARRSFETLPSETPGEEARDPTGEGDRLTDRLSLPRDGCGDTDRELMGLVKVTSD